MLRQADQREAEGVVDRPGPPSYNRADQGVASMAKIGYPVPQEGRASDLDCDGAFVDFDAEADFSYLLGVVESPKRRREPELVIPSPVLGAS